MLKILARFLLKNEQRKGLTPQKIKVKKERASSRNRQSQLFDSVFF